MGIVMSLTMLAGCGAGTEGNSRDSAFEAENITVRIGSLKGPTSMGLVCLMDRSDKGEAAQAYEFTMTAAADELLPAMILRWFPQMWRAYCIIRQKAASR